MCATAFVLVFAAAALAEGFALYEYSARGIALGGAVVARKPDASAVAYNPALLAHLPGINAMAGLSAITPVGKMDTYRNGGKETTGLRESTWFIPHVYYTHRINDALTFGVGEFTRYGLGFEYPHDWPGRFNIYEVSLQSGSVNPNLAWAVTDKLSLAVGAEIVYVDLDLKKRVPVSGGSPFGPYSFEVDSNIRKASDTGLGWNAAAHCQFNDLWALGFLYRSQARIHAKGEVEYTMMHYQGPDQVRNSVEQGYKNTFRDGKAHSTVILPDAFTGGIAFTPVPELSFEFAATYTRWSSFRDLNIHLPQPIGESRNHKHWEDVWRLGFGIEYSPLDWLTLRAGYVFDQSPMPSGNNQDYLVPTNDRDIWSLGVGFRWESWTLDLSYAFIDAKARSYHENAETGVLRSRTHEDNCTHIGSVSLGYRF
jgi:long-chain fatty acid transport protein